MIVLVKGSQAGDGSRSPQKVAGGIERALRRSHPTTLLGGGGGFALGLVVGAFLFCCIGRLSKTVWGSGFRVLMVPMRSQ